LITTESEREGDSMKRLPLLVGLLVLIASFLAVIAFLRRESTKATQQAVSANVSASTRDPLKHRLAAAAAPITYHAWSAEYSTPQSLPPLSPNPAPKNAAAANGPVFVVRVLSPTSFVARVDGAEKLVNLAGVKGPGECSDSLVAFNGEAQRYFEALLSEGDVRLQPEKADAGKGNSYLVRVVTPQKYEGVVDVGGAYANVDLIQNGYGCVDDGDLPRECPIAFGLVERIARGHKRGMWRGGSAMADGFVSRSQNSLAVLTGQPTN
jgi:hypothetical protein